MDIEEKDVKSAMNLAFGYNRATEPEMQLAGMILVANAIHDHQETMGRLADVLNKLVDKVGIATCHIEGIKNEFRKAVEIYKHSE